MKAPQQNPLVVNAQLRQMLLATGARARKNIGTYTGAIGGSTRIKLYNVGIGTHLSLRVLMEGTIGVHDAVATGYAPYNLIRRLRITDYDGTDRVNLSGYALWVLNSVRKRQPYGWNNAGPIFDGNGSTELGGVVTNPRQDLTTGANKVLQFYLQVPICYDPEADLRGAILMQTAVGEIYLTIDWAPEAIDLGPSIDVPYTGQAGTTYTVTTDPTVEVWQHYLLPQAVNGQLPLPPIDLSTVYELNGNVRSSDNLAVGNEKLLNYPNVRTVIGAYFNYVNDDALAYADGDRWRTIVNGNNILTEQSVFAQMIDQRVQMLGDLNPSTFYLDHRSKPVETALFGNFQAGFTPLVVTAGNTFVEQTFESFYVKGAILPGLNQG